MNLEFKDNKAKIEGNSLFNYPTSIKIDNFTTIQSKLLN